MARALNEALADPGLAPESGDISDSIPVMGVELFRGPDGNFVLLVHDSMAHVVADVLASATIESEEWAAEQAESDAAIEQYPDDAEQQRAREADIQFVREISAVLRDLRRVLM